MDKTIDLLWKKIIVESENIAKGYNNIVLYKDSYDVFKSNFHYYTNVVKKFMKKPDENLDRHKISAILICSILNGGILGIPEDLNNDDSNAFLGNEMLAFNVALSYMHSELKEAFKRGEVPYEEIFETYQFPEPYSCENKFPFVICRELFYTKKYFELNPISLSDLLFFIEDYTFLYYGIKRNK